MKLNLDQFSLDCENYRAANGRDALFSYMGKDGKLWVVKKQAADEVVLHGVCQGEDLAVSPAEFAADFRMVVQDESVFVFGSKEQQEAFCKMFEAELEAVRRCLYGKAQLPAVISQGAPQSEQPDFNLVDVLKNRIAEGHPIHVLGRPDEPVMSAIEAAAQGIAEETGQPVRIVHHIQLPKT